MTHLCHFKAAEEGVDRKNRENKKIFLKILYSQGVLKMLVIHFVYLCLCVCVTNLIRGSVCAVPKYETSGKSYNDNNEWSYPFNNENKTQQFQEDASTTKDRLQRLGYTTGYGALNGYPAGTGISTYNPIKLDLGGVVLGTLVGIGAIIIIPKILSAFHGGYASYGRSENENYLSSLTNFMSKFDDILGQNNVDSTSCMQRAICSYVRSTEYNMQTGVSDQMDEFIHELTENSLVDYLLDGTAFKEALRHGKKTNAKPCEELYTNCPLDSKKVTNLLIKMLPKKARTEPLPTKTK